MAEKNAKSTDAPDASATEVVTVSLRNPTPGRRVIYDGIGDHQGRMKSIVVNAGETKHNVTLHKSVLTELRDRNRAKKDSDLVVVPLAAETETA